MFAKWAAAILILSAPAWTPAVRAADLSTEQAPGPSGAPPQETSGLVTKDLSVTVGKSLIIDSPVNIQRVSVANADLADVVAISPKEVLVNGKLPGETTFIIWQQGGNRLFYDLAVRQSMFKIDAVRQELQHELGGQDVALNFENDTAFISGTVKDLYSADRAEAIAKTLGRTVNLLQVAVPPVETQILLKVRFADVDRNATLDLGFNLFSNGATNTIGQITTGQYADPVLANAFNSITGGGAGAAASAAGGTGQTISDALNILLIRRDLNLAASIKALQAKNLLEILAEPNVLAINNKPASFVSGGEFPYPTLQGGGAGLGAVTIQFREFGIRLQFLPTVTPRGTIRLQVMPEVSSLDYSHGLTFQGFAIPGLATRRIQTEIELESGQSFAIAGLLDNQITESLSKIPGLANIPLLGKLFQSKGYVKQNGELLILVTPEIVRPIPEGQPRPDVNWEKDVHYPNTRKDMPQTPGLNVTGPVPVKSQQDVVPVEQLQELKRAGQPQNPQAPTVQFVPVPVAPPSTPQASPGLPSASAAPSQSSAQGTTGK
jgi:pilus assembly protein CpaC